MVPTRYSRQGLNLKAANREVIVLKSELEEKQETKDLARFATQLTQGYFAEFEKVLLSLDENVQIRDALAALDTAACALQSLCSFEYCIERHAGEN